jgi:hypothetical protein
MPYCICQHSAEMHPDEKHVDGPDEDATVFPCVVCDCDDYESVV